MNDQNILEMENISKSYPGVRALNQVSISAKYGEVHALMGENGAGKSTLMKILSGVHSADSGIIRFCGKEVTIRNQMEALNMGISMIYQEVSSIPDLSIAENIYVGGRLPQKIRGIVDWDATYEQCSQLMKKLNLSYNPKVKMRSLSIADMQMIEIVRAISFNAKMIIMDEPTSALTEAESEKLFEFIRDLKKRGITVIIITHKLGEVFEIADRVTVLRDGEMIGTKEIADISRDQMITMMVGRDIKNVFEVKDFKPGKVVLSVKNLNRGSKVQDISFQVREGEVLGFSGIMGAGRTETMRCIFGLDKAQSGEICINGNPIKIHSVHDTIKNGIVMVTEDRKKDGLILCRSIYENMLLPSTFCNSKCGVLEKKKEKKLVSDFYGSLSIKAPSINTMTNQLSGGNQQKVIIAKWLLMNPKVLILDEPTRGIDVATKVEIYKLMREMNRRGVAIILVSSDMEELLGVSDRIIVMCQGHITGELEREEFDQKKVMAHATQIG